MTDLPATVETLVEGRSRDLLGFPILRVLPFAGRRTVGPFIFLDQLGPVVLPAGRGLDVPPHPHIGLATVTYLLAGRILHRDSLGSRQAIEPGDVNWMTAGRGIVHSERSAEEDRRGPQRLHGLQFWVALPEAAEETEPAFAHHGRAVLPLVAEQGAELRLVAGSLFGRRSPVATLSPLFLADARLATGARLALGSEHEERAAYLLEGEVEIGGLRFAPGRLVVFRPGAEALLAAPAGARLMLLGGASLGPRHIWWNFVSSRPERIEQAKADWRERRFGQAVPGETEFVPLP